VAGEIDKKVKRAAEENSCMRVATTLLFCRYEENKCMKGARTPLLLRYEGIDV